MPKTQIPNRRRGCEQFADCRVKLCTYCFQMLREKGYTFDIAFTSVLKRAIKTLNLIQDSMDLHWIPVVKHWRLNERMYGALQGLNKAETAAKHGEKQVQVSLFFSKKKYFCHITLQAASWNSIVCTLHFYSFLQIWRRSYATPPPPVDENNEHWPGHEAKYQVK